jgi:hypothetical protein
MMMEHQAGLTLFNAIATAGRTLYDIAQATSKLDEKQQLMEVYDTLMNLKREASELEDQNHDLKEKLRFKGEDFEFKNPFHYDKTHPDRPLCAKCFANDKIGPMSEPQTAADGTFRRCLVCDNRVQIERAPSPPRPSGPARSLTVLKDSYCSRTLLALSCA